MSRRDFARRLFEETAATTLARAADVASEKRLLLTLEEQLLADDANLKFHERRKENRPPDAKHARKFRCRGCDLPLGLGPADGIDDGVYHPYCAAQERASRLLKLKPEQG